MKSKELLEFERLSNKNYKWFVHNLFSYRIMGIITGIGYCDDIFDDAKSIYGPNIYLKIYDKNYDKLLDFAIYTTDGSLSSTHNRQHFVCVHHDDMKIPFDACNPTSWVKNKDGTIKGLGDGYKSYIPMTVRPYPEEEAGLVKYDF